MGFVAFEYFNKGYSVIPMSQNKVPLIEFADKKITAAELVGIWDEFPNANIALRTTDFMVIDVDGLTGADNFENIYYQDWFPDTLTATTASGGKHYLFKKPKDKPVSQKIGWLPNVDVKAHENNYILVAPSITRRGQYRWDDPEIEIADLPDELYNLIYNGKEKHSNSLIDYSYNITIGGVKLETTSKVKIALEMIYNGFLDGARNDTLARLTGALLSNGVPLEMIWFFTDIANSRSTTPLSEAEYSRTVESMIAKHNRGIDDASR